MMFGDTFTLWSEGRAWLDGQYTGLYPLPFVMLWSLLARLRVEVVVIGVLIVSVVLCVVMFKREALLWIIYLPILESAAIGQISLVWLLLLRIATPLSLALLTLKPQLWILAVPYLLDVKIISTLIVWCAIIYLPSLVVRPTWPVEWLQHIAADTRITGGTSASLWPVPMLALACAVLLILSRRYSWRVIFTAYNAAFRPYDYTILAGMSRWLIPISWLAGAAMITVQAAWPMALVGIAAALLSVSRLSKQYPLTHTRSYDNLTA